MSDKDLNQRIKEQAEPGVLEVIRWALLVHEDTMARLEGRKNVDQLSPGLYTVYEREEARKILLDYGAGKPARIMIHKGSKKEPICFETRVGSTVKQLKEPEIQTIDAEVLSEGTDNS